MFGEAALPLLVGESFGHGGVDDEDAVFGELRDEGAPEVAPAVVVAAAGEGRDCAVALDVEEQGEARGHSACRLGIAWRGEDDLPVAVAGTLAGGMNEDAVRLFAEAEAVFLILAQ